MLRANRMLTCISINVDPYSAPIELLHFTDRYKTCPALSDLYLIIPYILISFYMLVSSYLTEYLNSILVFRI